MRPAAGSRPRPRIVRRLALGVAFLALAGAATFLVQPLWLADVLAFAFPGILWRVRTAAYPFDPAHPPAGYIRWLVGKNLAPGTIVILHDGIADPSRMLQSLDAILDEGRRRGLRFVPVGELLKSARPAT